MKNVAVDRSSFGVLTEDGWVQYIADYSDLMPCPKCGACTWLESEMELALRDLARCGECNAVQRCEDLQYPLVGADSR